MDDDEEEVDISVFAFDGHSIHDNNPSIKILYVECVCICGRHFGACIGCLINGDIGFCPVCASQVGMGRLN